MTGDDIVRKLTVILSADAEGYSRLMGEDDVHTVKTLNACRVIISEAIMAHNGRVVDSPGDNVLAEFDSVVNAVQCALAIQKALERYNADLPGNRQMAFRLGVNLGEVIIDTDRIYGEGVNIAARLEGLAPGGGICISGKVYDQVQNKMAFGCEYIGEQTVKNIPSAVRVFRIWEDPEAKACTVPHVKKSRNRGRRMAVALSIAVLLAVGTTIYWNYSNTPTTEKVPADERRTDQKIPDKPAIAVLPFENLSVEGSQEYLCDGITRDLITDLSKFSELDVTAGYMSYKFKGKKGDLEQIGRELRVRYVLEGSMQSSGDRIRINAQLIEVPIGKTLWADRYDRKTAEMFDVQDEIIQTIVRVLSLKISEAELARIRQKDTSSYEAYDYVQQGWYLSNSRKRPDIQEATQLFLKAAAIDPTYAAAYAGLAKVRMAAVNYGLTEFPGKTIGQALNFAQKAVSMDPNDVHARSQLGYIYMRNGEYDLAIKELEAAIKLNPNDWRNYRNMGAVLLYSGQPEEALEWYEQALQYDPSIAPGTLMNIGIIHFLAGQYETAERWLKENSVRWPDFLGTHIILAATYAELDRLPEARHEVSEIKRISPFFNTRFYGSSYRNPEHRARIVRGLAKAGLQ